MLKFNVKPLRSFRQSNPSAQDLCFSLLQFHLPPPTQSIHIKQTSLPLSANYVTIVWLCHDLSAHLQTSARAVWAETHCFSSRWQCQEWSHFMCERKARCVLTEQRLKAETVLDDNSPSTTWNGTLTLVTHALYLTSQGSFYYLPGTLGNLDLMLPVCVFLTVAALKRQSNTEQELYWSNETIWNLKDTSKQ